MLSEFHLRDIKIHPQHYCMCFFVSGSYSQPNFPFSRTISTAYIQLNLELYSYIYRRALMLMNTLHI